MPNINPGLEGAEKQAAACPHHQHSSLPLRVLRFILFLTVLVLSSQAISGSVAFASTTESKLVRILLTAFSDDSALDIGIYGNYTLNDSLSFQKGSKLRVYQINGSLQVHYEGLVYMAGQSIRLHRFRANEGENGLRLNGQMNLYPGDLRISIQNQKLASILTIGMEDYLQGVVPFEMADEFPLEALKAQAIAARTYSVKHLDPAQSYDMVDNTNDQVFRGVNPDKTKAIRAVQETEGITLTYQGEPASAFYTASNGGFTESALNAWGRESIPYLQIQKDQYDTENPASIFRGASLQKDWSGQLNPDTSLLKAYLEGLIPTRLESLGIGRDSTFEILGLQGLSVHTGKHGGDAGVLRNLKVDLSLRAQVPETEKDTEISLAGNPGETQNEETARVWKTLAISIDCPLFPDMEQLFSLSINRNENEIAAVLEREAAFELRFSRYGHGVGMSQRGAEWMASEYGWNYQQILRFYYPGTELIALDTRMNPLPTLDMNYSATPGPAPTATPRPTLMPLTTPATGESRVVYVTGVAQNSSLNLRLQPDFLAEIVTRLYYGQALLVIKEFEDGWLEVKTDTENGFVRHEYVGVEKP